MPSRPTHLECDIVNILASMALDIPNYPRVFFETGYSIESIEQDFEVIRGGNHLEYKFDLVLNNNHSNHSLTVEAKSGGTDQDQLERYRVLTSQELVSVGGVSSHNPSLHTHDITVAFNYENQSQVLQETQGFDFTLLSVSSNPRIEIRHMGKQFEDEQLQAYFNDPILYPDFVHEVFPVHSQTSLHKYVKLVCHQLVSFSVNGYNTIDLDELAPKVASTHDGLWPARIGEQMRRTILRNVEKVLRDGSTYELGEYFGWNNREKQVLLRKIKPGCRGTSYKAFRERANEMSERIRLKGPVPARYVPRNEQTHPDQIILEIPDDE